MNTHNRTGHALISTMAFVAISSIVCVTAFHRMDTAVRAETASQTRMDYVGPSAYALAWALSLLETGEPPETPRYQCQAEVVPDVFYVMSYQRTGQEPLRYRVDVRPATEDDVDVPTAPESFNANQDSNHYRRYRSQWRNYWTAWWQRWRNRKSRWTRRPWHEYDASSGDRGWGRGWGWGRRRGNN